MRLRQRLGGVDLQPEQHRNEARTGDQAERQVPTIGIHQRTVPDAHDDAADLSGGVHRAANGAGCFTSNVNANCPSDRQHDIRGSETQGQHQTGRDAVIDGEREQDQGARRTDPYHADNPATPGQPNPIDQAIAERTAQPVSGRCKQEGQGSVRREFGTLPSLVSRQVVRRPEQVPVGGIAEEVVHPEDCPKVAAAQHARQRHMPVLGGRNADDCNLLRVHLGLLGGVVAKELPPPSCPNNPEHAEDIENAAPAPVRD